MQSYAFYSDEDIDEVVVSLAIMAQDTEISVSHVHDPKRMIEKGLWPVGRFNPSETWAIDWIMKNYNDATINFWDLGFDIGRVRGWIKRCPVWKYKTMQTIKREALSSASSLALLLYSPEMVYKVSKRPKTDMSLFRMPNSRTISRSEIRNMKVNINGEIWNVLPVTRYASGMSRGLYFNEESPEGTCGTFYYYEPESSTYLAYKTLMKSFNKTSAAISLGIPDPSPFGIIDLMKRHIEGTYPRDLIMSPEEASKLYLGTPTSGVSPDKHYAASYLNLYAVEDPWDQPLCVAASQAGYDIVILENMVGKFQVVTEVLDTRSRQDSFLSLLYII